MFTCVKCGNKLKTLHERVYRQEEGKKHNVAHYEPRGYHCERCRIYYDAGTGQTSRAVYGVAKIPKKELGCLPNDELCTVHETHAFAAQNASVIAQNAYVQNAYENSSAIHEITRAQRDYIVRKMGL